MEVADGNVLIYLDSAALYASYCDSADVVVVVDSGYQILHLALVVNYRRGNVGEYLVQQGDKVLARHVGLVGSRTISARAVKNWAVELFVGSVEIHQQLENFVADLVKARVGTVDLVYYYDYLVAQLKRFLKHESGLRHRAFGSVYQKDNAIYHLQHTLYLAAEIGVAGGVDYVYLNVFVLYRGVFRQYGYSSFALDVVRVHYSLFYLLIFSESARLL